MAKFKLGIIQPRISYYIGGGEKIPYYHSTMLPSKDFEVILYTLKPIDGKQSFLYKDILKNKPENLTIKEFEVPSKFQFIYEINAGEDRSRWDTECLFFNDLIRKELEQDKPNAILSYYILDGLFKPFNAKNILYLLGYSSNTSEYWKTFFNFYDETISNSTNVKNKWNEFLNDNKQNYILPTGVNLPNNEKIELNDNSFNIVFAGRLIERKGILTLMEALIALKNEIKNIQLHILGDGPLKQQIEIEIKEKGLQNNVKLHGLVENPQSYFKSADICVFPSIEKEGLMGVVMEAMICNKAIITTINNGNEDIIENNKTGMLIEPKDTNQLIEKIKMLYEDEDLRLELGKNAGNYARENLLWEKHISKLKSLIVNN